MSEKTSTEIRDGHSKERDLEAAKLPGANADDENMPKDPNLVTWDGPQDPENPKNWPNQTKWRYTVAVSIFTFISPVSSAMIALALSKLGADLNMHSDIEVELALSIFTLAYAVGRFSSVPPPSFTATCASYSSAIYGIWRGTSAAASRRTRPSCSCSAFSLASAEAPRLHLEEELFGETHRGAA